MAAMAQRVDHKLLDQFLAHVLGAFKAGMKTQSDATANLAHLIAALDQDPGKGEDLNAYLRATIERTEDDV
jgi:hypothetical protein